MQAAQSDPCDQMTEGGSIWSKPLGVIYMKDYEISWNYFGIIYKQGPNARKKNGTHDLKKTLGLRFVQETHVVVIVLHSLVSFW